MANKEAAQKAKAAGNAAFSSGQHREAVKHFSEAIGHDPTDHVLYSNRSGAYALAENFDLALKDAEKCVELNPQWAKGYSRRGLALYKLGKVKESVESYQKGLEIEPDNKQLQDGLNQARQNALMGVIEDSLKDKITQLLMQPKFQSYAREDPQYQQKLLKGAMDMFLQSGMSGMMGGMMEAPRDLDPKVQEGLALVLGGSPEEEEEARERAAAAAAASKKRKEEEEKKKKEEERIASRPDYEKEADLLKQEGNELYKKKKFDEAIAAYDKAAEKNPNDILILNNKAAVYLEMGEYDKCIAQCQAAIDKRYEVKADYVAVAKVFNRMAVCYARQKMYDEAISMYGKSLMEDNNRHTRAALKELERVKDKSERESYIDPVKAEEHKEKGNEFYKNKDFVSAKKEYDEAIKRNPNDPKLYSNRAAAFQNLLEYPSALKDAEKAIELDPKFVKAWSRKGTVHFMMKAYTKAQEAYRRGLQIDPENAECKQGIENTMNKVLAAQRNNEVDEDQVKQAMADPEIQNILSDPQFRLILDQISQNPAHLQEALKEPKIAEGLQKLMAAGIVRFQ